ncbi:hypothetical protein V498_08560 [Pseudogymnoascus sp. VKM F-4517 (FW-2822)]|nr:hypothetical protein V498_08560 [Pseudogymnoascus sp. VKM F-4517 (FW-2822)]
MPSGNHLPSRPLSVAIPAKQYCPRRPTLREVLANSAPPPWTLSAFTVYLSQNHCLETLEFTMDATLYRKHYEMLLANCGEKTIMPSTEGCEYVRMLWQKLLDAYISPDSPRKVNLPGDVRQRLLSSPNHFRPPSPQQLDTAIRHGSHLTPECDGQTFNSAHSHQLVQPSHLALALKYGVKFIHPSPSSSCAEANNDSFIEHSMSAESSSSLGEFMTPLRIPHPLNSNKDTSESSSKVSRADESDWKKMG